MQLVRLESHPEFKLKDGEPDLCKFMVLSNTGEALGQVSDAIADTESMSVKYLVVTLFHPGGLRRIVPISALTLNHGAETATCVGTDCADTNLSAFPIDHGGEIPDDLYRHYRGAFIPGAGSPIENITPDRPIVERSYAISRRMKHLDEAADAMRESAQHHADREHARGIRHPGEEEAA